MLIFAMQTPVGVDTYDPLTTMHRHNGAVLSPAMKKTIKNKYIHDIAEVSITTTTECTV